MQPSPALPLLVLGVRLPSAAFNYSLSSTPEEANRFSFSLPSEDSTSRPDVGIQTQAGLIGLTLQS